MSRGNTRKCGMKVPIPFLIISFLAFGIMRDFATAQDRADPGASKILALENKWNEAYKRGDIATMGSLLAEDFVITVEDGSTFSKTGYLAHNGDSTVHVQTSEMTDLKVRMHGNTAVVTGGDLEKRKHKGRAHQYGDRL